MPYSIAHHLQFPVLLLLMGFVLLVVHWRRQATVGVNTKHPWLIRAGILLVCAACIMLGIFLAH